MAQSILDQFLAKVKATPVNPYPVLYARDSMGNVRTWQVEVQGDKYRFVSGMKGGALVTSEWTVCKGKNIGRANETSAETQATKEAKAAMALKLKSGGYWQDEADIDKARFFAPMLAHKYVELDDDNNIVSRRPINWSVGVWASPKMDGLRCIINREGAFSRKGNKFVSFPHIERELQALFAEFPGLVLDGECYTHALKADFDKIISLARKTKPTPQDIKESEAHLEYHIFDCPTAKGGYGERYAFLQDLIAKRFAHNRWIKLCDHVLIKNEKDMDDYLSKCVEQGFEGAMMNLADAEYESDKRSYGILKYKMFQDEEGEIVDVIEGDGNRAGMMGRLVIRMKSGRTFKCDAQGGHELYKRLLREKQQVIGKEVTYRFQNYTPDGIPRFAKVISIRDYE